MFNPQRNSNCLYCMILFKTKLSTPEVTIFIILVLYVWVTRKSIVLYLAGFHLKE